MVLTFQRVEIGYWFVYNFTPGFVPVLLVLRLQQQAVLLFVFIWLCGDLDILATRTMGVLVAEWLENYNFLWHYWFDAQVVTVSYLP